MVVRETANLTRESVGGAQEVLDCTQACPPGNKHQKGPICLWEVGEVTESRSRAQVALFPLGPLPHIQHHNTVTWVSSPW